MEQKRSNFSSKIGFVLASAGSAVGLGNIWRFPYLAAQYGGGTFLLTYLILVVTFGFTLMIAETAIGRKTGLSAIEAYGKLSKRFSFVGVLTAMIPILILPYYSVIGGWVTKYLVVFATGGIHDAATNSFFGEFNSSLAESGIFFMIFVLATAIIVFFGVQKGVEAVSKFMMPVLVILTIGIAVYVLTIDGAIDGAIYYLKPNFKNFTIKTFVAAMGQMFYSMSLAMGIMVTYGSYMKKENHLESSVRQIEIFDTGFAFLSGLMIIPAIFALEGGIVENKGAGLMFVVLPQVFEKMAFGGVIGALFFLLVLLAALTSSISLMETIVSFFMDKFKWSRKFTCIMVTLGCLAMGVPSLLGYNVWNHIHLFGNPNTNILDIFDFISNSILMPIVAFFTCILVGYIIKPKAISDEVKTTDGKFKSEKLFTIMIKWIAPLFLLIILGSSLLEALGIFKL